ncbi:deoxyribonuclease V [Ectothiorhodospiraceae bacterium 2226]|nr:deoxyribonuclease V [Ectothiorhodospiraceae bacterium 2226]
MTTRASSPAWPTTTREAIALQEALRAQVVAVDRLPEAVGRVAGVDVGFEDSGRTTRAAVAVVDADTLIPLEHAVARLPTRFPYVPGLLSFRELPAVLEALAQLSTPPALLLCDAQGLAHPRRFGLACHLGVITDLPSIGVAKSRLLGTHDPVPTERGAWVPLYHREEQVGAVLRTRTGVQPVYVSIGHRISLPTAIAWVLRTAPRFRLPEPARLAHRLASG